MFQKFTDDENVVWHIKTDAVVAMQVYSLSFYKEKDRFVLQLLIDNPVSINMTFHTEEARDEVVNRIRKARGN